MLTYSLYIVCSTISQVVDIDEAVVHEAKQAPEPDAVPISITIDPDRVDSTAKSPIVLAVEAQNMVLGT